MSEDVERGACCVDIPSTNGNANNRILPNQMLNNNILWTLRSFLADEEDEGFLGLDADFV
jgi:hypothetical protein